MAGNGQPGRQIAWDSPPVFGEAASMALVHAPPVPDNQPALVRIASSLHAVACYLVPSWDARSIPGAPHPMLACLAAQTVLAERYCTSASQRSCPCSIVLKHLTLVLWFRARETA